MAPALGAAATLGSVQWQVVASDAAAIDFNFCIENLTAIQ
jgi:hypothetical protein